MNLHEEIAVVAYELFERDGSQHGRDKEHWSEAEQIVTARRAALDAQTEPEAEAGAAAPTDAEIAGSAVEEKKAETQKAVPIAPRHKAISASIQADEPKETAPKTRPRSSAGRIRKTTVKERVK